VKIQKRGPKKSLASTIRSQEFSMVGGLGKKGYDPTEVRNFLSRIAKQVEELEKKVEELQGGATSDEAIKEYQERIELLESQLERLSKENEELKRKLKEASESAPAALDWDSIPEDKLATELLRMAKETGDRIVEQKKREAAELLKAAQSQAEEILQSARVEELKLKERLNLLKSQIAEAEDRKRVINEALKGELSNLIRKIENLVADLE